MDAKLEKALSCLDCRGSLKDQKLHLECSNCSRQYKRFENSIILKAEEDFLNENEGNSDSLVFKIKNWFKRSPRLFRLLHRLIYPVVGKSSKKFIQNLPQDALIINLGSGIMSISPQVIDVDRVPYSNVAVVADAHLLPFKDESVDAVIAEHLLEHLSEPGKAVAEIKRILKPGGLIYILTPFMLGFHSSPNDYYRWTTKGLEKLFEDFHPEELGVAIGPTSAMTILIINWLSGILSFGSRILYQIWLLLLMIFLIPVNWLDFLFSHYRFSSNNALALYFIGKKKHGI